MYEKYYIWNHAACTCENGKYLESIIDNSVFKCGKVIEVSKTVLTKRASSDLYILLTF